MITIDEKTAIIETLGNHYSNQVLTHFAKKHIVTKNGTAYKPETIRKIVNGERENSLLELEILKLLQITKRKATLLELQRNKLISKN